MLFERLLLSGLVTERAFGKDLSPVMNYIAKKAIRVFDEPTQDKKKKKLFSTN